MRKITENGRFTIRNPLFPTRAERRVLLLATLAGAGMMGLALSPRTAALAAEHATEAASLTITGEPVCEKKTGGTAADRVCAGQAWGNETSDCLLAVAFEAGGKQGAKIRVIAIQ